MGFEVQHLRLMFYCSSWNRGYHDFPHISAYTAHQSGLVNGIALNNLDKAGNYVGTGNGIVLARLSGPSCKERNNAATSNLKATIQMSDNENVHYLL